MKILYVASTYIHLKHFHLPYLNYFHEKGDTVHIAAGGTEYPIPYADQVWHVPFQKSVFSPANFRAAWKFSRIIRRENYDLIAVHTTLAAFFTRLALRLSGRSCPVCNTVHGYLFDDRSPFLKRTAFLLAEKSMASVTDTVAVMNREDWEIAEKHRLYRRQLKFIRGMGVDFSRFPAITDEARRNARDALGFSDSDFVLTFAGEFSRRKNQKMLIGAMTMLPEECRLLLLGDGGELEQCRRLAEEKGVAGRVIFAGYQADTPFYYAASDLCVSSSRSEGLPFNLMEAMHMGLPVAATRVKGHTDLVIPGRNGILAEFDDEAGFAREVTGLIKNPARRNAMGGNNRKDMENYSLSSVFEENVSLYEELLHR